MNGGLETLPPDLLGHVFCQLDNGWYRRRYSDLRLVCKRWKEAFDDALFRGCSVNGLILHLPFARLLHRHAYCLRSLNVVGAHFGEGVTRIITLPQSLLNLATDAAFLPHLDLNHLPQLEQLYFVRFFFFAIDFRLQLFRLLGKRTNWAMSRLLLLFGYIPCLCVKLREFLSGS